jgi:phosphatidate phosphatase APP1
MVDWLQFGADAEEVATRALQRMKRVSGRLRPMVIRPYRGWVADGVAHVRARVLEEPRFDAAAESLSLDSTIYANLMRWVVLDLPGVEVRITVGDVSVTERTDTNGFVVAKIPVGDLPPGWHRVHYWAVAEGREVVAQGRVVVPDPAAQVAVISDIDDTILSSGITEGIRSVQRTLLRDAHGRRPIPGMPSLYRGLARGREGHPEATFFYVSKSPWNLYDVIVQFLAIRGFPRGPVLLREWRPGVRLPGIAEDEPPRHKNARIRRILDCYPDLPFILIGDDGEADPAIFKDFLASDPDQIDLALVRSVRGASTKDARDPGRLSERPRKPVIGSDALQLARVAHRLGYIDELTVDEVKTELGLRL